MTNQPVVAGVDGSPPSTAAAARDAALRGKPLRIVHGFIWPYMHVPLGPSDAGPPEGGLRHEAERIVAEAVDHVRAAVPGIEVTGEVVTGSAAQVLIRRSADAAMIVVGDRGLGAFGDEKNVLFLPPFPVQDVVASRHETDTELTAMWTARVEPDAPVFTGQEVTLRLDLEQAYFFDAETGLAIERAEAPSTIALATAA